MRFVFALLFISLLVFVSATQDEDRSLSRLEREAIPARGNQKKGNQNKRKSTKKRKSRKRNNKKGRTSKKTRKNNKRTNKKRTNKKNKKSRKSGKARSVGAPQGRQAFFGDGCQYINLLEIVSAGNGCENGKKFVLKGNNARRQFLIMEDKVLLAFVTLNTKFTECTSFTDVTSQVTCKTVDGLDSVSLEGSSGTTSSGFKCGVKKAGTRIVGGEETEEVEYPWMVALGRTFDGGWAGCGGTLVGKEWVVTAAHCLIGASAEDVLVILGEHNFASSSDGNRLEVEVNQIVRHPNYNQETFQNDLALLRLSTPVDLNVYTPACLPASGQSFDGKTAFAYGWGTTTYSGSTSNVLLDVALPVVSLATCKEAYSVLPEFQILDGMICAGGTPDKDSCQGDSGGPLTSPDDTTGQHYLIGATSFGFKCAEPNLYGVYVDIAYYRTFMDQQFEQFGGISLTP